MRVTSSIACLIVAFDCAEKAVGIQEQFLFSGNWVLLWWAAAFAWFVTGINNLRAA